MLPVALLLGPSGPPAGGAACFSGRDAPPAGCLHLRRSPAQLAQLDAQPARTGRRGRQQRARLLTRAGDREPEFDDLFTTKPLLDFLDGLLRSMREQLEENNEMVRKAREEVAGTAQPEWLRKVNTGMLTYMQNRIEDENRVVATLETARAKVQAMPLDTELGDAIAALADDPALQEGVVSAVGAFWVYARTAGNVAGALLAAWLLQSLFGMQPWELAHWPAGDQGLAAWAGWTAPFLAVTLVLAATRRINPQNPARPLSSPDDSLTGWQCVLQSGLGGSIVFAGGVAFTSGLVYRGAWLSAFEGFFLSRNGGAVLDSGLVEESLRTSMGTLVPQVVPLPAFVLLGVAVLATACFEVIVRAVGRTANAAEVVFVTDDEEVITALGKEQRGAGEVADDAGRASPAPLFSEQWYSETTWDAVAAELLLSLYLGAETVATGSLYSSVATHAAGVLLTLYACRAGLAGPVQPVREAAGRPPDAAD